MGDEVKWIKITTNMFDDEKIKLIESMPDADSILVIWIKLLIQAGKTNANGYIFLNENIPYTDEMLATIFDRPLNTVRLALNTFKDFGMVQMDDKGLYIENWVKHQNIEGLNKLKEKREKNRLRQEKFRKKQKLLEEGKTGNVMVTLSNGTELELELDKEKDKDQDRKKPAAPYNDIKKLYTNICESLPSIRKMTDSRRKHIKARWEEEKDIKVFKKVFEKAENSSFLTGNNDRDWNANFDWIIKNNNNWNKILEGKYDDEEIDDGVTVV